jgi:hypothetical protein
MLAANFGFYRFFWERKGPPAPREERVPFDYGTPDGYDFFYRQHVIKPALIGMLLSWVGLDLINGQTRFTFGIMELNDGIGIIPLVMGLFGISEVFLNIEKSLAEEQGFKYGDNVVTTMTVLCQSEAPAIVGATGEDFHEWNLRSDL